MGAVLSGGAARRSRRGRPRRGLALLAAAAAAATGCVASFDVRTRPDAPPSAAATRADDTGGDGEQLPVIDAHVHTIFDNKPYDASKAMDSREGLADEMRRNHVVGAVSMNHAGDAWADLGDLNVVHCVGLVAIVDEGKLEADLASGRYRCIKTTSATSTSTPTTRPTEVPATSW